MVFVISFEHFMTFWRTVSSGLAWLRVWYGARLHLALGLAHAQWATLIRAGWARSSARLSSVRVLAWYPTRLGSRLHSRLGSARLRSGSIRSVWVGTRGFARLDSKLGCIGSKPCSAWLEARFGSAQASDRLGLDSGLRTRLGTRFGSRPDSGSGTGSALFENRLGSKRCSPRCLIRLDSGLTWGSELARGSGWTRSSARSAGLGLSRGLARMILGLVSSLFGSVLGAATRLSCGDSARFGSVRGSRGKHVINTLITLLRQINIFGRSRTQYYQHLNVASIYIEVQKDMQ